MTTTNESAFFERLKKHPELKARFEARLDVAEANGNGPDTAYAVGVGRWMRFVVLEMK